MHARMVHGLAVLLMLLAVLGTAAGANAQGVVVRPPECDPVCPDVVQIGDQLTISNHHVDVTIVDQLATTEIEQTLHNPNDWTAEGAWLFPVPAGAAIDQFTMTVDGKDVEATCSMPMRPARSTGYRRQMRDRHCSNTSVSRSFRPVSFRSRRETMPKSGFGTSRC